MKKRERKILKIPVFIAVYVGVILACIGIDQLTKFLIFDRLLGGDEFNSVKVLGKFLQFTAIYNEGAAFGMAQSDGANIIFFIITIVGIPLFSYLLWRSRKRSVVGQIGFAFIVGGTIGNAIDRSFVQCTAGEFFSGKVRDFISFSIFPPIFNVADSFLVVGVILAVVAILFTDPDSMLSLIKKDRADKLVAQNEQESQNGEQIDAENVDNLDETSAKNTDVQEQDSAEKPDEKN